MGHVAVVAVLTMDLATFQPREIQVQFVSADS
jgi:hypothetical protein